MAVDFSEVEPHWEESASGEYYCDVDDDVEAYILYRASDRAILKEGPECDHLKFFVIGGKEYFAIQKYDRLILVDLKTLQEETHWVSYPWYSVSSNSSGDVLIVIFLIVGKYLNFALYEKIAGQYQEVKIQEEPDYERYSDEFYIIGQPYFHSNKVSAYKWIGDRTIQLEGAHSTFQIMRGDQGWVYKTISYTPEYEQKLARALKEKVERSAYKERIKKENPQYLELARGLTITAVQHPLHLQSSPYYRDMFDGAKRSASERCFYNPEREPSMSPFSICFEGGELICYPDQLLFYSKTSASIPERKFETVDQFLQFWTHPSGIET